ncbi:hypothetical protein KR084_004270, partial [Drosophila pseudotakahashii]
IDFGAGKQTLPMREMADLDAVHLGLDENEADIAEELQDFEFNTRSEASESNEGDSTDSEPSISSVSTATSSLVGSGSKRKTKKLAKESPQVEVEMPKSSKSSSSKNKGSKREPTPEELNGGNKKKKRTGSESKKTTSSEPSEKVKSKSPPAEERQPPAKKSRSKKPSNANDSGGHKSDASEAEDEKPALPTLESDSESSDSDSGTQHKRNGGNGGGNARGKPNSKSSTPEKDSVGGSQSHTQKGYDYMTKLNYLFRDTRFFLIKSNNSDNVQLSKSKSVWATLPQNDANLNQAFKEARNVLLIFSVNESGKFAGFARMAAPSRRDIPQVAWVLPPSISPKALGGVIELDWICRKELSFNATLHLHNTWNEGKPVKIGRDGQEIEPKIGAELCRLFPEDEQIELTPILKKSKETARVMREKGIHVIYKPPRSLSSRGHGGGGGGRGGGRGAGHDQLGPMRHKRSYHGPPHHRPYRHHHGMGLPPGGGFKRSGSPYRQMGGGAGAPPGGPGDMTMPAWERYMSSAAAAEAYVADYMRNMHGQLPPLPFVPPFAQLPMPGAGAGAAGALPPGAAAMYEQLPPPVRYYDGPGAPPLPDYPPPQRPPPPGFDKAPSYEEFAAWKNAGLPTVPPPGFPVYGGAANGGSNGAGGAAAAQAAAGGSMGAGGGGGSGGGMGGGPGGYRNRDGNNGSAGPRRREYGNRSGGGSSRDSRPFRERGGGGGQRSYRDNRR